MKFNKVVIFKGSAQFNMLRKLSDDLAIAFKRQGSDVRIIDLTDIDKAVKEIHDIKYWKPDLAIGFTPWGLINVPKGNDKIPIHIFWNCKFVSWLVDSAISHFPEFEPFLSLPDFYLACPDSMNDQWVKKYYPSAKSFVLLHAISINEILPFESLRNKRDIKISFLSSIGENQDKFLPQWKKEMPPIFYDICLKVVEHCFKNPHENLWEKIEKAIKENNVSLEPDRYKYAVAFIYVRAERFLRYKKKLQGALALKGIGLKVWGDENWKDYKKDGIDYVGLVDATESNKIFQRSNLILHIQPPQIIEGLHERLLIGMANGAVAIAEGANAIKKLNNEAEQIIDINLSDSKELRTKINSVCRDNSYLEKLARNAHEEVLKNHTLAIRIKELKRELTRIAMN